MLNLSIMPLDEERINEICEDIITEEKRKTYTHAMFTMYLQPEGTPPKNKAAMQCRIFDKYKERLDPLGAKYGILVQSTMGHITPPIKPYPFTPTVSLNTGEVHTHTCCPLDENFRAFMKNQMHELALHSPSMVMLDDDIGLIYRGDMKGCACPLHMAEFNKRAGTDMTREELLAHTRGNGELDKKYTDIYVETVRDSIVGFVKAMREGLDEVDPTIQGIVSGIYVSTFCEFSADTAEAFAGKGNPRIARLNGGMYTAQGPRFFSKNMYRAAMLRENTKDNIDIYLAETDTCPHNRYSTSATLLHAHFTASILEGAKGAKHWLTRLPVSEVRSGTAYREKLSKYAGFYESLADYTKKLTPFGCRIPLPLHQEYGFSPKRSPINTSPWSTCVIERLGFPLYFGNTEGGAVFLDDLSCDRFTDNEIRSFFKGTVILSGGAVASLTKRGFVDLLGVSVSETVGKRPNAEIYNGKRIPRQVDMKRLELIDSSARALSYAVSQPRGEDCEVLFPASTLFNNPLGGITVTFAGNPDTPFNYYSAFSFLTETRKAEFTDILSLGGHLPVYYPGDLEVYMRAGTVSNGEMLVALFDLSLDGSDEVTLKVTDKAVSVEKLNADGERIPCEFQYTNGELTVFEALHTLEPMVLFIKS